MIEQIKNYVYWSTVCLVVMILPLVLGMLGPDVMYENAMAKPFGSITVDPMHGSIFVADVHNGRVLRFDGINTPSAVNGSGSNGTGLQPSLVLGQPNMSASIIIEYADLGGHYPPLTLSLLIYPTGLHLDERGTLWVADLTAHRVLWWHNASTISANGAPADGTLGSPTRIGNGDPLCGCNASAFCHPSSISVLGDSLWLVDSSNGRVLRFDNIYAAGFGSAPGEPASAVIGCPDFLTSCSANPLSAPPMQLVNPALVLASDHGLYVHGLRTLFYPRNQLNLTTGASASYAYGAANISAYQNVTATPAFYNVAGMTMSLDGSLIIADVDFNRVLFFGPTPPTMDYQLPVDVVGQPNFTTTSGALAPPISPFQMTDTRALTYDSGANALWVLDGVRILRYASIVPVVRDNSTSDTQLQFVGRSPFAILSPKVAGNAVPITEFSLRIQPLAFEEIDIDGNTVASVSVALYSYAVTNGVDLRGNQVFAFDSVAQVTEVNFEYTFFDDSQNVSVLDTWFDTKPGLLKLSLGPNSWNFSADTNFLRVHTVLILQPTPFRVTPLGIQHGVASFEIDTIAANGSVLITTMRLLETVLLDNGTVARVNFSVNIDSYYEATDAGYSEAVFVEIDIPHFTRSFLYDPDFAVELSPASGDDGGSESSQLYLLSILAVLLAVPAALIMVCLSFTVVMWARRQSALRATRSRMSGHVNVRPEAGDAAEIL